jgi:hypothetical protein
VLPGVPNNNLINRHSVAGRTRYYNNLINRYSVAGSTRTVARTVGSDQGQYLDNDNNNNLINRYSVAGSTRTVARTITVISCSQP